MKGQFVTLDGVLAVPVIGHLIQTFDDHLGLLLANPKHQHHEFIPAVADERVRAAKVFLEEFGKPLKDPVTCRVPQRCNPGFPL